MVRVHRSDSDATLLSLSSSLLLSHCHVVDVVVRVRAGEDRWW